MAEKINVVMMPLEDIYPYERNPRRNDKAVEAVANSIREFGFKNPIIVDADHVIISGHTRRLAALYLGLKEVPVSVVTDMSEQQVRAFRLADNRVAEISEWDEKKLKEEIAGISSLDLGDFGFDLEDINKAKQEDLGIKVHKCPRCGAEWRG